jgi:hypothetical protein
MVDTGRAVRQSLLFNNQKATGPAFPVHAAPFFANGVMIFGGYAPDVCEPVEKEPHLHIVCSHHSEDHSYETVVGEEKQPVVHGVVYEVFNVAVLSPQRIRASFEVVPSVIYSSGVASTQLSVPALPSAMSELSGIVDAIKSSLAPPAVSPEFDALLDRALACRGMDEDIDQWAARIADRVAGLND